MRRRSETSLVDVRHTPLSPPENAAVSRLWFCPEEVACEQILIRSSVVMNIIMKKNTKKMMKSILFLTIFYYFQSCLFFLLLYIFPWEQSL